jgi:hypothetical protein
VGGTEIVGGGNWNLMGGNVNGEKLLVGKCHVSYILINLNLYSINSCVIKIFDYNIFFLFLQ